MMKTVYSALAVTALLAGTASFAADQTVAPAAATPATASTASNAAPVAATPAKAAVKAGSTHHAGKTKTKESAAPASDGSATSAAKK